MGWVEKIRKRQEQRRELQANLEKEERRAKENDWRRKNKEETDRYYRQKLEREQREAKAQMRTQEDEERRLSS